MKGFVWFPNKMMKQEPIYQHIQTTWWWGTQVRSSTEDI